MSSCCICIENITKFRYEIECTFCKFKSCSDCVKRYLIESISEPKCMSCGKVWNRRFLGENFNAKFIKKTFKEKRENYLLEKEKSLLPSTQIFVEAEIRKEQIKKESFLIRKEIDRLKNKLKILEREKNTLDNSSNLEKDRRLFVKPCSFSNCKGFLSRNWSCGLCGNKTCKDCNEIEEDEHKCDPNNVETAKLLSKDTKGCPNCGTQIFKIEGCDQMFCTQCHTPFSWKTGKIDTGIIHNPHYFEWLRNNGGGNIRRNIRDIQCGRDIDNNFIREFIQLKRTMFPNEIRMNNILQRLVDLREVKIPTFRVDRIRNNRDLRIRYMRNQITEEQFKRNLQKREKDIAKREEITELLGMTYTCSAEIFYRIIVDMKNYENYLKELDKLNIYVNECFEDISKIYNCRLYKLTADFLFY